jgi:hypothetical protein
MPATTGCTNKAGVLRRQRGGQQPRESRMQLGVAARNLVQCRGAEFITFAEQPIEPFERGAVAHI